MMYKWSELADGNSLRSHKKQIIEEWKKILANPETNEQICSKFIKENAGFFFWDLKGGFSISELQLGKDFRLDFVRVKDRYSLGAEYTLIELETPNDKVFKKGSYYKPTKRLEGALAQIRAWDIWLKSYTKLANETFPASHTNLTHEATYKYQIIIGRRSKDPKVLEQLKYYEKEYNVEIRSFDYLTTDCLEPSFYMNFYKAYDGLVKIPVEKGNKYQNPFYKSYSSKNWTEMVRHDDFNSAHMISRNLDLLLEKRKYNDSRLKKFIEDYHNLELEEPKK